MADQKPDGNEGIISDGNTFVLRFLITLVLITYFIVPRPPESQLKVNANVGEGERLIDQYRVDILDAIRQSNRDLKQLGSPNTTGLRIQPSREAPPRGSTSPADLEKQRSALLAARRELREKLIKLNGDYINLEKARVLRQVAIPTTSFSLTESDVRMLYPGALAAGLLLLLRYRRKLLKSFETEAPTRLPVWAAPVPLRGFGQTMRRTLVVNIAGLTLIGSMLLLYRDFILRDEFYPELRIAVLQLLLGCAVAAIYGFEAVHAIAKSFAKAETAGSAR